MTLIDKDKLIERWKERCERCRMSNKWCDPQCELPDFIDELEEEEGIEVKQNVKDKAEIKQR